jgi:hypothetical protein
MITLKILFWFVVITGFVLYDYVKIKKGERPFYLVNFLLRGIAFVLYGAFVWDTQYELRTLNLFLFCVASFWVYFDILLGSLLHGNPFYIGPNSGWIDRAGLHNKWTNIAYWILKILALYVAVQTCINIYTKFE